MALKASIHYGVLPQDIPNKAAREFRDLIDLKRLSQSTYTVICYPGMRGESSSIVNSGTLIKAIERSTSHKEPLVVIAHNFTSEALDLIEEHKAIAFYKSSFFWTDESLAAIRQK